MKIGSKGASNNSTLWIVVIAIVAIAFATGVFSYSSTGGLKLNLVNPPSGGQPLSTVPLPVTPSTGPNPAVYACGNTGKADWAVRFRNGYATSANDWQNPSVSVIDASSKAVVTSATPNTDGTFKTTTGALVCGNSYQVVVINSATYGSQLLPINLQTGALGSQSGTTLATAPVVYSDIVGYNYSALNFNMYTNAFANDTAAGTNSQNFQSTQTMALAAGGSFNERFDVGLATGAAQWGSFDRLVEEKTGVAGSGFICIVDNPAKYSSSAVGISAPVVLGAANGLPRACSLKQVTGINGVGNQAFEVSPIKPALGRVSGSITIRADVAAPVGGTDNVRFQWQDNGFYTGQDGRVHAGTVDDTNADIQATDKYFEMKD